MRYVAASKDLGSFLGVKLHEEWGLVNHESIQSVFMPDGSFNGHDRAMCIRLYDQLKDQFPALPSAVEELGRYHVVLGCISQYNLDDITYFCRHSARASRCKAWEHRYTSLHKLIERKYNKGIFWVPSFPTMEKVHMAIVDKSVHLAYI